MGQHFRNTIYFENGEHSDKTLGAWNLERASFKFYETGGKLVQDLDFKPINPFILNYILVYFSAHLTKITCISDPPNNVPTSNTSK
jgi:hypothetical protein